MNRYLRPLTMVFLLLASPALAQQVIMLKVNGGTGFFVNRDGNVITNAHVVRNCQSIFVQMNQAQVPATLVASDDVHDLAVLHVAGSTPALASLRWNIADLKVGDPVVVMGYPGQAGIEGHYSFVKTTVAALDGPRGEPNWLQLASIARQGNSGGPVLDMSGNVIAVVAAKAETYRVEEGAANKPQLVHEADVAVTLGALRDFLRGARISYYEAASGTGAYPDSTLEETAHRFIVPVRCVLGRVQ